MPGGCGSDNSSRPVKHSEVREKGKFVTVWVQGFGTCLSKTCHRPDTTQDYRSIVVVSETHFLPSYFSNPIWKMRENNIN